MKTILIESSLFDRAHSEMRIAYDMELWNLCCSRFENENKLYGVIYDEIREYTHGKIIRDVYNPIHYRK